MSDPVIVSAAALRCQKIWDHKVSGCTGDDLMFGRPGIDITRLDPAGQFAPFGGFLAEYPKLYKNPKNSEKKRDPENGSILLKGRFFRDTFWAPLKINPMASAFEAGAYAIRQSADLGRYGQMFFMDLVECCPPRWVWRSVMMRLRPSPPTVCDQRILASQPSVKGLAPQPSVKGLASQPSVKGSRRSRASKGYDSRPLFLQTPENLIRFWTDDYLEGEKGDDRLWGTKVMTVCDMLDFILLENECRFVTRATQLDWAPSWFGEPCLLSCE